MMLEVTLTVQLGLVGPVLSRSTAIGNVGIDAPMACDSTGKFYLPFSLMRGRLRQAWEEIMEATDREITLSIDDLLGMGSDQLENTANSPAAYEPRRGVLHFTDFQFAGNNNIDGKHYRIRIDETRGAADDGALQVIESPFAPGQRVYFTGTIRYIAHSEEEADAIQSQVAYGLRWLTHLGGERTVGFGRLVEVTIQEEYKPFTFAVSTTPAAVEMLQLAIRPLAPLCVSKRPIASNLFESEIVLSGSVMRGTLATTLKRLAHLESHAVIDEHIGAPWQELGTAFNDLRFSHAFPAPAQISYRPVVAPLSLVKDEPERGQHETVYDVVLCEGPGLLGNPPRAPRFAVDWKTSSDVAKAFGWAEPARELRVRTAMDREHRRAKDAQLFAYEMVVPDGVLWYGHIDLRQVPQASRAVVAEQLRAILHNGLHGIGKTKVMAKVQLDMPVAPIYPSDPQPIDNFWVVTLQTPALLCDPALLHEGSGASELRDAYDEAWKDLSGGTLQLVRFFASQSLVGGYQVLRFQANTPYNPFLLTESGSVFVLQASGEKTSAQGTIERWLQHGLPLPGWAQARYGDHWRTCPFRPADGFGEVAVNLPCHVQKKPGEGVWHAL